ncbi:unnamed protein product [Bursaphelenchus okinawaensis]|uniref:Uncharacterized protein n=1 Tax=Bursaphelenchus okinawaensis TaxID=465554 RepID=A0A811JQ74_9BILA|nr:unnamed protein product [Bursaphelenchus okinawaensis]CAG9077350.1 unnamed protein product [Bursaphelenchus okinawaensis]
MCVGTNQEHKPHGTLASFYTTECPEFQRNDCAWLLARTNVQNQLLTATYITNVLLGILIMYKVFSSYNRKSEKKQHETGKPPIHHADSSYYQSGGGSGLVHRSASAQRLEGPFVTSPPPSVRNGVHGSQNTLRRTASKDRSDYQQGTYSSEYRSQQNGHQSRHQAHHGSTSSLRNGGGRFYDTAYAAESGAGGALTERRGSYGGAGAHSLQRHTQTRSSHRQGFSESSSYETNEHFERKVERVKRTRGERSRSRSKTASGSSEYESRERMAIKPQQEATTA